MSQVKDALLVKVDNSMIWYSLLFNNKKKWFSNQSWILCDLFFKVIIFIEALNANFFFDRIQPKLNLIPENKRFLFSLFTYIIDFNSFSLIINIYFKSDLMFFRNLSLVEYNNPYIIDEFKEKNYKSIKLLTDIKNIYNKNLNTLYEFDENKIITLLRMFK